MIPCKLDRNKKTLQKLFSEDANVYDDKRFGSVSGKLYNEAHYTALSKMLYSGFMTKDSFPKNIRVLDVAMGTGRSSVRLSTEGVDIVGIDITIEMMKIAKNKTVAGTSLHLVQGDAFQLPFQDDSFDAVICCRMLQMIPLQDYGSFGTEVSRVLRPNGTLIAELWNKSYQTIRCLGRKKPNTWGLSDTFITPSQSRNLFGEKYQDCEIAGLGFPLIFPLLGRISETFSLSLYSKLTSSPLTKTWGETFLAQYRHKK